MEAPGDFRGPLVPFPFSGVHPSSTPCPLNSLSALTPREPSVVPGQTYLGVGGWGVGGVGMEDGGAQG